MPITVITHLEFRKNKPYAKPEKVSDCRIQHRNCLMFCTQCGTKYPRGTVPKDKMCHKCKIQLTRMPNKKYSNESNSQRDILPSSNNVNSIDINVNLAKFITPREYYESVKNILTYKEVVNRCRKYGYIRKRGKPTMKEIQIREHVKMLLKNNLIDLAELITK